MPKRYPTKLIVKDAAKSPSSGGSALNALKSNLPFFETWAGLKALYRRAPEHILFEKLRVGNYKDILRDPLSVTITRSPETELAWLLGICLLFKDQLLDFCNRRLELGTAFLAGNIDEATLTLDRIEAAVGPSLYTLERRFLIGSERGGIKANKELLATLDLSGSLSAVAASAFSLKNDGTANYNYYQKVVQQSLKKRWEPNDAALIAAIIDPLSLIDPVRLPLVIGCYDQTPIVDRFNLATRAVNQLMSRTGFAKEKGYLQTMVGAFLRSIPDPTLAAAARLPEPQADIDLQDRWSPYFSILAASERECDEEKVTNQETLPNGQLLSFEWIHAVAVNNATNPDSAQLFTGGIAARIKEILVDFYNGSGDAALLSIDLSKIALRLSDSSLGAHCLYFSKGMIGSLPEEYSAPLAPLYSRFSPVFGIDSIEAAEIEQVRDRFPYRLQQEFIDTLLKRKRGDHIDGADAWMIGFSSPYLTEPISREMGINDSDSHDGSKEICQQMLMEARDSENGVSLFQVARLAAELSDRNHDLDWFSEILTQIWERNRSLPRACASFCDAQKNLLSAQSLRRISKQRAIGGILLARTDASVAEVVRGYLRTLSATAPSEALPPHGEFSPTQALIFALGSSSSAVINRCALIGKTIEEFEIERRRILQWVVTNGAAAERAAAADEMVRIDKSAMIRDVLHSGRIGALLVNRDVLRDLVYAACGDLYEQLVLIERGSIRAEVQTLFDLEQDPRPLPGTGAASPESKSSGKAKSGELLSSIVWAIATYYLFDDDYGFDALLSVKVRHNLVTPLRAPFQKYGIVLQRDGDGFVRNANLWSEVHEIEESDLDVLQQATAKLDNLIARYREEYLQVTSRRRDDAAMTMMLASRIHPEGWFDFSEILSDIGTQTFLETIDFVDFDDLFEQVYRRFSDREEQLLKSAKSRIEAELHAEFEAILRELTQRGESGASFKGWEGFYDRIENVRRDLPSATEEVGSWFEVGGELSDAPINLDAVVEATIRSVERNFGQGAEVAFMSDSSAVIDRRDVSSLYDVFLILTRNMFEHGSNESRGVTISEENDEVVILYKNKVPECESIDEKVRIANDLIDAVKAGSGGVKMRQEGRTGFVKAFRILTRWLGQSSADITVERVNDEYRCKVRMKREEVCA